mmetsp:Transcript_26792/g.54839  ORF Transcript_26792/g.54839 Transcript_26792/m.54839 type:complete len:321 (+) Transcript_26792:1123-2085(+)
MSLGPSAFGLGVEVRDLRHQAKGTRVRHEMPGVQPGRRRGGDGRRGRSVEAVECLQRPLLLHHVESHGSDHGRDVREFQRDTELELGRYGPGARPAPIPQLQDPDVSEAVPVRVPGLRPRRGDRRGRHGRPLPNLRLELEDGSDIGRARGPPGTRLVPVVPSAPRDPRLRVLGRDRETLGCVQVRFQGRIAGARRRRRLRVVPSRRQGAVRRYRPGLALLLERRGRDSDEGDRRQEGHCGGAEGQRSADVEQQRGVEVLHVGLLHGRRDVRSGGGKLEVCLHIRGVAENTAEEVSDQLQSKPGWGAGRAEQQEPRRRRTH